MASRLWRCVCVRAHLRFNSGVAVGRRRAGAEKGADELAPAGREEVAARM